MVLHHGGSSGRDASTVRGCYMHPSVAWQPGGPGRALRHHWNPGITSDIHSPKGPWFVRDLQPSQERVCMQPPKVSFDLNVFCGGIPGGIDPQHRTCLHQVFCHVPAAHTKLEAHVELNYFK